MACLDRKTVLICITVCFVAMVTGVSLQLHLLSHEHSREHDIDSCSICRQLLIAHGKFALEQELTLDIGDQFERDVHFHSTICVKRFHCQPSDPRPPPAAL